MALVRVSGPAVEPVTLAEAKSWLRIDSADDDDLVTFVIRAAREAVENYTRRVLISQTWRYLRDGFPGFHPLYDRPMYSEMYLPKPPFLQINSFTYVDVAGDVQDMSVYGFQIDPGGQTQPARVLPPWARPWPPTRMVPNAIVIEFECGYGTAESDVPSVFGLAIRQSLAHFYENRQAVVQGNMVELPLGVCDLLECERNLIA